MDEITKTKIKICGLTRKTEADYLNENAVDYAGFVFFEKSKRNVSIEHAGEIMSRLNEGIKRVAVTVSPDVSLVSRIEEAGFDILQIHGDLDMEVLKTAQINIWRAVNIADLDDACEKLRFFESEFGNLNNKIKGILIDAPDFGSGKTFDWHKSRRLLKAGDRSSPFIDKDFILAGGLNADNVAEGIKIFEPDIVDVSSSVEGEEGKSEIKIREFVNSVRGCER